MPNIEREQEEIKRGLLNLVQKDGNNKCADCGALRPRWASVNLGVFVCIRCSGVHRDLGVHISVVRSISLDKWRTEWVKVMKKRGNVRVNKEYAARLPEHEKIDPEADGSHRTQFIRAKYADKRYFKAKSKAPKAAKASKADGGGRFRKCAPSSGSDSSGDARAHRKSRRHARARHRRRKSPAPSPLPSPAPSAEVSDSESPEESGAKRRHRRKQKRHAKAEKTEGKRHTKPEKAGGKRHAKPERPTVSVTADARTGANRLSPTLSHRPRCRRPQSRLILVISTRPWETCPSVGSPANLNPRAMRLNLKSLNRISTRLVSRIC
eukprot:357957_1